MQWEPRPETGPAASHGGREDRAEEEEAWRTPAAHLMNESKPEPLTQKTQMIPVLRAGSRAHTQPGVKVGSPEQAASDADPSSSSQGIRHSLPPPRHTPSLVLGSPGGPVLGHPHFHGL